MILTIKASVAAAVAIGLIAASAGATYITVKAETTAAMACPSPTASQKPNFPTGPRLPVQGKTY